MEHDVLMQLGLSNRQARIYLSILKEDSTSPTRIAKNLNVNRTTILKDISWLLNNGYLSQSKNGKRIVYQATSPDKIITSLSRSEKNLTAILPQLVDTYNSSGDKPLIHHYEGADSVLKFLQKHVETVHYAKTFFSPSHFTRTFAMERPEVKGLIETLEERQIINRGLCSDTPEGRSFMRENKDLYLDMRVMPAGINFDIECIAFESGIVILSYKQPFALEIRSTDARDFVENIFEYLWQRSEKITYT